MPARYLSISISRSVFNGLAPQQLFLHLEHLALRAKNSQDRESETMSASEFMQLLISKIDRVNFDRVRDDVLPFIKDEKKLDLWGRKYFNDLVKLMKFA